MASKGYFQGPALDLEFWNFIFQFFFLLPKNATMCKFEELPGLKLQIINVTVLFFQKDGKVSFIFYLFVFSSDISAGRYFVNLISFFFLHQEAGFNLFRIIAFFLLTDF